MTAVSTQRIARLTGGAYLGIIVSGIFAEFVVRMSLVVPKNAALTSANIASSESLFRSAIAADLLMIALDIGVAVGLYALLQQVHRPLAQLAAALRLIQAAVLGANLMNLASALGWATASQQGALSVEATQTLALSAMELHRLVYDLGLVFFGLSCLVLGRLIWVSRLLPRVLGVGLSLAGGVYLLGSFAVLLAPDFAPSLDLLYGLALAAELGVAQRLLWKGVAAPKTAATPGAAAPERLGETA